MNPLKTLLTTLVTFCVLSGGLALTSAPASALTTHPYLSKFNGSLTPQGSFVPRGVAANESSGKVYVVDGAHDVVDVFSASGSYISQLTQADGVTPYVFGTPNGLSGSSGIAVDQKTGEVYVADPGSAVVDVFNSAGVYQSQLGGGLLDGDAFSVAVNNSTGEVYVADSGPDVVYVFSAAGALLSTWTGAGTPGGSFEEFVYVGVDQSSGDLYVAETGHSVVDKFGPTGDYLFQLTQDDGVTPYIFGPANGGYPIWVEGDSSGDAYVVNQTDNAVDEFDPSGKLIGELRNAAGARFGDPPTSVAVGAGDDLYITDTGASTVDVFGPTTIALLPEVESESVAEVGLRRAALNAQVNALGNPSSTYYFEYGTSTEYASKTPTANLDASSEAATVSAKIEGLQPETVYHYRIVVTTSTNGTSYGPDATFTTLGDFPGLPDGRGFEMVSPVDNADGNVYEPVSASSGSAKSGESTSLPMRAAADGDGVEYVADPPKTGGNGKIGNTEGNEYVATRAAGGVWSAVDLETPGLDKSPFEALLPSELSNSGTSAVAVDSHILGESGGGLFDIVGGRSIPVNVLPDGKSVSEATFGGSPGLNTGRGGDLSHVISADGSHVFWTQVEVTGKTQNDKLIYGPKALYVREDGARTVQVDATQGPGASGGGRFWTASSDGSKVFFTDCSRLTGESTAVSSDGCEHETGNEDEGVPTGNDLYEYNVETGGLADLTIDHNSGDSLRADVLGVVGASEGGSYVYFVANGVLGDGAEHGASTETCTVNGEGEGKGLCNLYVVHGGVTTFIAAIPGEELYGPSTHEISLVSAGLSGRAGEVSPDGHALVFQSRTNLTGYDSRENTEVYMYDADTARISCVSCNPTGVPATSGASLPSSYNNGFMRRWVSEGGDRVFFQSNEALVAGDTNGVQDVYEWEREGAGSCAPVVPARLNGGCIYLLSGGTSNASSFFLDASANGDDVFIISRAHLTEQDPGKTYELYDARVGATEPVAEQACTGTGCQGLPAAPPPFATPSSETIAGIDDLAPSLVPSSTKPKPRTLTRSQRLTGALRSCRKGKRKRARSSCERKAQRAYGRKSK